MAAVAITVVGIMAAVMAVAITAVGIMAVAITAAVMVTMATTLIVT
jgi:hypothetical protein